MITFATYSQVCLLDEHYLCFDVECDCQCHDDEDESADGYPMYDQDFPGGW